VTLLRVQALSAFYGDFQALFGVSLDVAAGETVAVIGANGAGKSTFLRAVAGALPVPRETVRFDGRPVGGLPAPALVERGLVLVPEGRKIFPSLSVHENLLVGAYRGRPGPWTPERVYRLFPVLGERRAQPGTNLSGGEQQMLAIGRGLMANPRLLLVDEISLGLAPVVVQHLYEVLEAVKAEGTTLLVVEQDFSRVLALAQHV
jgi:branched-chain amino acid transport system ATP-binding protein